MSKFNLLVSSFFVLSGLFFPRSAFASFPFDTNNYLKPPTTVNVQFHKLDLQKYYVIAVSGIWDAISYKLPLEVKDNGTFNKTINVENTRFRGQKFLGGVTPEDGVFTISGTYKKGQIRAEWTYALEVPPQEGWKYPEHYTGSGVFYTTQPVSETSGAGIIEGSVSVSKTKWKDVKMVDHIEFNQTDNFQNTWTAVGKCNEPICGCFDYGNPEDSQARFNTLTGEVGYVHCNKDDRMQEWIPATPKTKLMVDDHVSTGQDSFAVLQFKDMTTFQMKPETEVIVKSPPEQETKLGLVSGHLWINFKKMLTNGTMEVEMGQAVAGIKGTTLVLEHIKGSSTLKVIDGTVSFKSRATGKSIDVKAGEKVSADFNGLSKVEKFDVDKENTGWKKVDELKKTSAPLESTTTMPVTPIAIGIIVVAITLTGIFIKRRNVNG